MRWNCPHCEELVTAGIDFESTKKAYVRCARCNGMALIHRSAVLADYVKARRMEEEAQLELEIRLEQEIKQGQARQASLAAAMTMNAALDVNPATNPRTNPPAPNARMLAEANIDGMVPRPPPFVQASIRIQEESAPTAAPPVEAPRRIPVPPAFLIGNVEAAVRAFASDEISESVSVLKTSIEKKPSDRRGSSLAVWIAAALALASGIYLYHEGKRALAPSTMAPEKSAALLDTSPKFSSIQSKKPSPLKNSDRAQ